MRPITVSSTMVSSTTGVIVIKPVARLPSFDLGLRAGFAEQKDHARKLRTYREQNQETEIVFPERNFSVINTN
jgi:hypothetical protein